MITMRQMQAAANWDTGFANPESEVRVQPVVGPPDCRWMTYLIETGEIDGGTCKCYACQRVRDGYERWKYEKLHNPQPAWRSNRKYEIEDLE